MLRVAVRRCRSDVWVEVGIFAMDLILTDASGLILGSAACRAGSGTVDAREQVMIISSPIVIILSTEECVELTARANAARRAHREVRRAHIVLAAAAGAPGRA